MRRANFSTARGGVHRAVGRRSIAEAAEVPRATLAGIAGGFAGGAWNFRVAVDPVHSRPVVGVVGRLTFDDREASGDRAEARRQGAIRHPQEQVVFAIDQVFPAARPVRARHHHTASRFDREDRVVDFGLRGASVGRLERSSESERTLLECASEPNHDA